MLERTQLIMALAVTGLLTVSLGLSWDATGEMEMDEDELKEAGWVQLFNEEDLTGWQNAWDPDAENHWFADEDGSLTNEADKNDIATVDEWKDFELMLEYKTVPGGNSGVYLRGRVEVQVLDSSQSEEPRLVDDGAIYNQFAPKVLAGNPIGEWNQLHVKYVEDILTVKLNDHVIHDEQRIVEPTEGALPGGVNEAGPLRLQGDHGKVWYRNIWLRPLDEAEED